MAPDLRGKRVKYKRLDIDMGIGRMIGFVLVDSFMFEIGPFYVTVDIEGEKRFKWREENATK